jgi:hypothetical protein
MAAKKKPARKISAPALKKHRFNPRSKANLKPWQPGQSGNPAGRVKGSRNTLSEQYLSSVCAIYDECGDEAVREAVRRDPEVLIKVVTSLLPKKIDIDARSAVYVIGDRPLSADEWAEQFSETPPRVEAAGGTAGSPNKVPAPGGVLRGSKRRRKD